MSGPQGSSVDYKALLLSKSPLISRSIVVSDQLLLLLSAVDFLRDKISVIECAAPADRIGKLLAVLRRTSDRDADSVFASVVAALCDDGQEHVANIISPNVRSTVCPMTDEHYQLLKRNRGKICRYFDPLNGVVDNLSDLGALNDGDCWRIKAQDGMDERAREAIDIISRKSDDTYDLLIEALMETGQTHIANIIDQRYGSRPMSDEHRARLAANKTQVCLFMDTDTGLLDQLVNSGALSEYDERQVRYRQNVSDRSACVVERLMRRPDTAYDMFINALLTTNQTHVASVLEPAYGESPMSEQHRSLLSIKTPELAKFINPVTVVDNLVRAGVFSHVDRSIVNRQKGETDMSRELLTILARKADSAFDIFLASLTDQQHVAYIITGQGDPPLSVIRADVLLDWRDVLADKVDCDTTTLIDKLSGYAVINESERKIIAAQSTSARRTGLLLDFLARKSDSDYDRFIQALKDTDQQHIARILDGLELRGKLGTRFRRGTPELQRNRIIHCLRNNIETLINSNDSEVASLMTLMEENGFTVTDVRPGSILVTFRCYRQTSFANFRMLFADKTLDRLFTDAFCPAFAADGLESIWIEISDDELERCDESWTEMFGALMSPEHANALEAASVAATDRLTITDCFLSKLPLTLEQREAILHCSADNKTKVKMLFNILSHRPNDAFSKFVDVLYEIGHNDVAQYLVSYSDQVSLDMRPTQTQTREFSATTVEETGTEMIRTYDSEGCSSAYESESKLSDIHQSGKLRPGSTTTSGVESESDIQKIAEHNYDETVNYAANVTTDESIMSFDTDDHNTLTFQAKGQSRHLLKKIYPCQESRIKLKSSVRGVALCDGTLFIVIRYSDTITVYDANHRQQPSIDVSGLTEPVDIVACNKTKQLYIADQVAPGYVWRVSEQNQISRRLIKKSTPASAFRPRTLSVTSCRLVITPRDGSELVVLGADGSELKRVLVADMISGLEHAVETSHATFVVCYREPRPGVCEVNSDGIVIHAYCGQLAVPCYLTLDSDDRVIVADQSKHCILLLNTRLEFERVLVHSRHCHLAERPSRLCYVKETGKMVVASWNQGIIQVYSLRNNSQHKTDVATRPTSEFIN